MSEGPTIYGYDEHDRIVGRAVQHGKEWRVDIPWWCLQQPHSRSDAEQLLKRFGAVKIEEQNES